MTYDKTGYREYLSRDGKADNTIDSYCAGINHISQHHGEDVFQITDPQRLESLYLDYSQDGTYSDVGKYGASAARIALHHWMQYVSGKGVAKTWLLTWNPENFKEGGDAGVRQGEVSRWTCLSKQPQLGDQVFLIRLGVEPRGIVAAGVITRTSFEGPDWRDATKIRNYIEFNPTETRPDCASGLLPMLLLEQLGRASGFKWSAQSSGISIPEPLASALLSQWETGRGKHSLRQYVEWSQADPEERRDDWLADYRARIDAVRQVKQGIKVLDDEMLDWLWRAGSNGVCTVSPGFLPAADYQRSTDFLRQLALDIFSDPSESRYQEVFKRWGEAQQQGLFSKLYQSVIHRVFAAASPESYTTTVNPDDCRFLLAKMASEFELPQASAANWAAQNAAIKACLSQVGMTDETLLENNVVIWQMVAALKRRQAVAKEAPIDELSLTREEDEEMPATSKNAPLNLILYGPPGTGKTYETIRAAVQVLEPGSASAYDKALLEASSDEQRQSTRKALKDRFKQLQDERRIRFVTFHQSFSYEDFVEGLRANTVEGNIRYDIEPGVFKLICKDAEATPETIKLDDLLDQFVEDVATTPVTLNTPTGKEFKVSHTLGNNTLACEPVASAVGSKLPANIEHIRSVLANKPVEKMYCESYVKGIAEHLRKKLPQPSANTSTAQPGKPYVLIIDEINRGNVSRIFGELITLIEPSKRAGASEELSVTLPYSKDPFKVPGNVYLIGTMNTADRSLAGLDIALRRRFTFKEMPPRPDLLDKVIIGRINVGKMLQVMNQRIAVLLGRDHCLGHAYFMPLLENPSLNKLAEIFQQSIIPLLQEYFFEDWERIRWVLNDHEKAEAQRFIVPDGDLETQKLFGSAKLGTTRAIWKLNPEAFGLAGSYEGIFRAEPAGDGGAA